nr:DNA-3-methyladenine glycosylase 2 family protein [Solirubrobacterales bacterium]
QQVSVAAARTQARRLVERLGEPLTLADRGAIDGGPPAPQGASTPPALTHVFPGPQALAEADPESFSLPRSRGAALVAMAQAIASGDVDLEPGADRDATIAGLLALRGIGPWTASYIAMRALGDPDAFLPTDLGVIHALRALGEPTAAAAVTVRAEVWRPWRSYAVMHLWATL